MATDGETDVASNEETDVASNEETDVASNEETDGETDDLLERLRAPGRARPEVDAGLAGGLRAWLEDGVASCVRVRRPPAPPLVVGPGDGSPRAEIARTLFRLAVAGAPTHRAFEDALGALSVDERGACVVDALRKWSPARRAALRREATSFAAAIGNGWHSPPAAWLPRVGERLRVPLGGGQVVLAVTADLALGRPADRTASVCMVEVRVGHPDGSATHHSTARDPGPLGRRRRLLALTETLRSGAPPFRVATYRPDSGDLECDDVTDALLARAVDDVLTAVAARAATAEALAG